MPRAWRLTKTKYLASAWDGEGARKSGGRWNSPGVAVVYVSQNLSLALLEVLVHLSESSIFPAYSTIPVDFDEDLVTDLELTNLPATWRDNPAPPEVRAFGDEWVAAATNPILRVPSTLVPREFNYLLNPAHPDSHLIRIGEAQSFPFDPRLPTP